jgi:GxxExxY protein
MNHRDTEGHRGFMRGDQAGVEIENRLSGLVIGAALAVHRELGPGYLESIYEEALCHELTLRDIPFMRQVPIRVTYKGRAIGEARLDLLIDSELIVELKAVDALLPLHQAQVISYLRATGHRLGLLINFNVPALRMGIKRIVL